jgi:hypothetical protein
MNQITETVVQILFKLSELLNQIAVRIAAIETGMANGRKAARDAQTKHSTRLDEIHDDVKVVKQSVVDLHKTLTVPVVVPVHPHWLTVMFQDKQLMAAIVTVLIALAGYLGHLQGRNSQPPEQTVLEQNSASHNTHGDQSRVAGRDGG